jgi:hypothetical protein
MHLSEKSDSAIIVNARGDLHFKNLFNPVIPICFQNLSIKE